MWVQYIPKILKLYNTVELFSQKSPFPKIKKKNWNVYSFFLILRFFEISNLTTLHKSIEFTNTYTFLYPLSLPMIVLLYIYIRMFLLQYLMVLFFLQTFYLFYFIVLRTVGLFSKQILLVFCFYSYVMLCYVYFI